MNPNSLLKKYKEKEKEKFWHNQPERRLANTLIKYTNPIFSKELDEFLIKYLAKILKEVGIEHKLIGNQLFINDEQLDQIRFNIPEELRESFYELGKNTIIQHLLATTKKR